MAKIHAPNRVYTGLSAGVSFVNGEGITEDPYLIKWFRAHGYTVEEPEKPKKKGGKKKGA